MVRRLTVSVAIAGLLAGLTAAVVAAQWPTTCVELNDIVEAHLGNHGNVGIYQRTFGDQAEAACQNDHRDDVRSVFAWAIGEQSTPSSTSAPQPGQTSVLWRYIDNYNEHSGYDWPTAIAGSTHREARLFVRCAISSQSNKVLQVAAQWDDRSIYVSEYGRDNVLYRFEGSDQVSDKWRGLDDDVGVYTLGSSAVQIANRLLGTSRFYLIVFPTFGDPERVIFDLDGQNDPNHPVRRVLNACGV
ncbi:MAG: hypothetical protein OXG46_12780 [Chloroflexi bacterium]|nr:hypothetical protein [Chloroflexota bacterium]MCY3938480.1 hypothetical protein [Chloroflexota bacterium]